MSDLLGEYIKSAIEQGVALEEGEHRRANRLANKNLKALRELRKSSDRGRAALMSLLSHESPRVRGLAAVDLLRENDTSGLAVLLGIAQDLTVHPITRFGAKMALEEWGKRRVAPRD